MELQTRLNNNHFAKAIIESTTNFIDKTFDLNFGEEPSSLLQMPQQQLELFSKQAIDNHYFVILTMVNEEQFQGKLIKTVSDGRYILEVNHSFYKVFELNEVKSINLIQSV